MESRPIKSSLSMEEKELLRDTLCRMKGETSRLSLVNKANVIVLNIDDMLNTLEAMSNNNFTLRISSNINLFYIQQFGAELIKLATALYELEQDTLKPNQTTSYCYSSIRSDIFNHITNALQELQVNLQRFIIKEGSL